MQPPCVYVSWEGRTTCAGYCLGRGVGGRDLPPPPPSKSPSKPNSKCSPEDYPGCNGIGPSTRSASQTKLNIVLLLSCLLCTGLSGPNPASKISNPAQIQRHTSPTSTSILSIPKCPVPTIANHFHDDSEKWSFRRSSINILSKVCAVGFEPAYCNL